MKLLCFVDLGFHSRIGNPLPRKKKRKKSLEKTLVHITENQFPVRKHNDINKEICHIFGLEGIHYKDVSLS